MNKEAEPSRSEPSRSELSLAEPSDCGFVRQVHVYLGRTRNRKDGYGPRSDALSAARGRHRRDPNFSLHRDQRDEDDGSSSGLRADPAGEGTEHVPDPAAAAPLFV